MNAPRKCSPSKHPQCVRLVPPLPPPLSHPNAFPLSRISLFETRTLSYNSGIYPPSRRSPAVDPRRWRRACIHPERLFRLCIRSRAVCSLSALGILLETPKPGETGSFSARLERFEEENKLKTYLYFRCRFTWGFEIRGEIRGCGGCCGDQSAVARKGGFGGEVLEAVGARAGCDIVLCTRMEVV